ncbi:unnamed protein product [Cochlearia groenlandica]
MEDSIESNQSISSSHALHQPSLSSEAITDKEQSGGEDTTAIRRKRRSRWDPEPITHQGGCDDDDDDSTKKKKRKSRWANDEPKPLIQLPDYIKDFDHEIQVLNIRLLEINRLLQSGLPLDNDDDTLSRGRQRSPSPDPIYDNMGVRVNTREYRAKEKLIRERQEIISKIINKNPAFKPPADYRPPKLQKKLYIPEKQFPGYSFIGLIIGPRGNTQKRMQRETGAKIVIRGKGSAKEGRMQQKKYDPAENEDLHVLIEADTQEAVEAAAGMVEKLLQPVDEVLNEHKRQQLRELATLNGTVRDEEYCRRCGEQGHRDYACPSRLTTFKSDVLCKICGDGGHPTIDCPMKGNTGKKMDDEYQNFLAELGGTVPESSLKQSSSSSTTLALGPGSSGSNPPWVNNPTKPSKEHDETNLYIGSLPPMLEDDGLIELFSSFGEIVMAKVIKDHVSGLNKGYGFVKYADVHMANTAVQAMNGYRIDGKALAVRIAGKQPTTTASRPTQAYPPSYQLPGATGRQPPNPPPGSYQHVHGQHMSPYGMYYPPPPPPYVTQAPLPPGTASQNPSSFESQRSFPPGVQAENGATASSVPPNVYGSSATGLPGKPPYMSYPSYYNFVPPPAVPASSSDHPQSMGDKTWANNPHVSTSDQSQGLGNAPWATNPHMLSTGGYTQRLGNVPWAPRSSVQPPAENPSTIVDSEYDKFMAEMK